jgi:hypothetical protein
LTPSVLPLKLSKTQSSRWQKLGAMDNEAFEARVSVAKRKAVASVEATGQERAEEKKAARGAREAELGARQLALPDKKYGVIYGDPPWRFEPWLRETGMDRAADNHYPTIALPEKAIPLRARALRPENRHPPPITDAPLSWRRVNSDRR